MKQTPENLSLYRTQQRCNELMRQQAEQEEQGQLDLFE